MYINTFNPHDIVGQVLFTLTLLIIKKKLKHKEVKKLALKMCFKLMSQSNHQKEQADNVYWYCMTSTVYC